MKTKESNGNVKQKKKHTKEEDEKKRSVSCNSNQTHKKRIEAKRINVYSCLIMQVSVMLVRIFMKHHFCSNMLMR